MVISGQGSSGLVHDGEGAADEKYEEDDTCSVGHADAQGHHCVEEVHRVRGDRAADVSFVVDTGIDSPIRDLQVTQ